MLMINNENNKIDITSITQEYIQHGYIKNLWYEITEDIIIFSTIYPMISIINRIFFKNYTTILSSLIILISMIAMSTCRLRIKSRFKFDGAVIFITILSSIISFLLLGKNIFPAILIICAFISIKRSKEKQHVTFKLMTCIQYECILMAQLIIAVMIKADILQKEILFCACICMIISISYICKARNVRILRNDDAPNESFRKKDSSMFALQSGILILALLLAFQFTGLFNYANKATNNAVNAILNPLSSNKHHAHNEKPNDTPSNNNQDLKPDLSDITPTSDHPILAFITKIILGILSLICIAIGLVIIYMIINAIMLKVKKIKNNDKVSFVLTEKDGTEKKSQVSKKNIIQKIIHPTNNDKVRRFYKNKIKSYRKNNVYINKYSSVNDIKEEVLENCNVSIDEISKIYEKARYSNEEVSKEEVKKLM